MTLPTNLILEKNKLSTPSAWPVFLDITLTDDAATELHIVRNTEDLAKRLDDYSKNGCVAHWKLNDKAATTVVADASGNTHTGTLCGGNTTTDLSVAGKINNALQFDGAADYIQVPDHADFNLTDYTLAAWVKIPVSSGDGRVISQQPESGDYWCLNVGDNGVVHHYDYLDGAALDSIGAVNDNGWHFIVAVRNTSGDRAIYIDGALDIDKPSVVATQHNIAADIFIGARSGTSIFFQGCIDNVMVFDRALSAAEIAYLYKSGNGTETIPILYQKFNFTIDPQKQTSTGEITEVALTVNDIRKVIGAYLRDLEGAVGSIVKLTVANSDLLHEDFAELEVTWQVMSTHTEDYAVVFSLGRPHVLQQRFPLHRFMALQCRWRFEQCECAYTGKTVAGVTLSGTNPVSIGVTGHGWATGDYIRLADIAGISPSLDGSYEITVADANNFSLDDTDSSDYSGAYTSGGTAGFALCNRTLAECRQRGNGLRFGGFAGMRSGTVKVA
jgi:phage-related protein